MNQGLLIKYTVNNKSDIEIGLERNYYLMVSWTEQRALPNSEPAVFAIRLSISGKIFKLRKWPNNNALNNLIKNINKH